jgi:hypothetical protein
MISTGAARLIAQQLCVRGIEILPSKFEYMIFLKIGNVVIAKV